MDSLKKIADNIEKVIIGKNEEVKLVLAALLCEGHLLIEDVPGVGKTILARAVALSTGCDFSRIQSTPDLLPSDIIGVNIFNQKSMDFEFRPGPIHNQIILADEINRATPKTQSALLECMEERQVTVDGVAHHLPRPFMVIATQNPIEYEGTFPLPESQLDRFFMRINLGYPDKKAEAQVLQMQRMTHPIESLEKVLDDREVLRLQHLTREIHVDNSIRDYIVQLVHATRQDESLLLGASPRGSIALYKASQARAMIEGRDFVLPDDVKRMAPICLAHRLILRSGGYQFKKAEQIVTRLLDQVPVPE